ncbi:MAG: hypothetical protein E7384_08870 [Ruminococcaceae bacterium]|nr:hypothetical protein [Oscillospiraceae bacterium]
MPIFIPLLIGAVSAISAIHGVSQAIEGADDLSAAKVRKEQAELLSDAAKKNVEVANKRAMDRLEKFAETKLGILSGSMSDFVTNYERIKHINFTETEGIDELKNYSDCKQEILQIKEATVEAKDVVMSSAAAIGFGALVSKGTQSVILHAVTKGGLAGAAASKHTLALIGGGSLKAGGLGMAGGKALLKGLNVGSALSLAGMIFASQAKKKYNDAEAEYLQAEALNEQAINTCIVLDGIMVRASQLCGVLQILDQFFVQGIKNMCDVIDNIGDDYRMYSVDDRKVISACVSFAITIKSIIDTTLLNADGELEKKSMESLMRGQEYIAKLEAM